MSAPDDSAAVDEWGQDIAEKDASFGRAWQATFSALTVAEGIALAQAIGYPDPTDPGLAAVYCALRVPCRAADACECPVSGHLHLDAERQRAHREGQLRIKHHCRCNPARVFVRNAAWAAHRRANPEHEAAGTREHFAALAAGGAR